MGTIREKAWRRELAKVLGLPPPLPAQGAQPCPMAPGRHTSSKGGFKSAEGMIPLI